MIDAEAQAGIEAHVARFAQQQRVLALPLSEAQRHAASFVAPAIIELQSLDELRREVFGPVLHVLRWRRDELAALIDAINATGYGLTHGIHSRIDETIDTIVARTAVGNVYVNRNIIGAVVGVQPFGGEGLSGTGPKAGGPWYLPRLRRGARPWSVPGRAPAALDDLQAWAAARGDAALAARCARDAARTPLGARVELPGPTGERNTLSWHARGRALCIARDADALLAQLSAVLATGNAPVIAAAEPHAALLASLPQVVHSLFATVGDWRTAEVALVLHGAAAPPLAEVRRHFAAREGARVRVVPWPAEGARAGAAATGGAGTQAGDATEASDVELAWLLAERVVSVNTAAAGGNASLMTLGPDA